MAPGLPSVFFTLLSPMSSFHLFLLLCSFTSFLLYYFPCFFCLASFFVRFHYFMFLLSFHISFCFFIFFGFIYDFQFCFPSLSLSVRPAHFPSLSSRSNHNRSRLPSRRRQRTVRPPALFCLLHIPRSSHHRLLLPLLLLRRPRRPSSVVPRP
uniref:Uncharacterized protein n=1 Tax=Cacopsylla melanoneura TaxID=428564 RepID=A0A8D8Y6Z3_9HEMI